MKTNSTLSLPSVFHAGTLCAKVSREASPSSGNFSLEASTFTLLLTPTFNPNRSRSCLSNFFSAAVSDFFLAAGMGAEGTAWTARTMLPSLWQSPASRPRLGPIHKGDGNQHCYSHSLEMHHVPTHVLQLSIGYAFKGHGVHWQAM